MSTIEVASVTAVSRALPTPSITPVVPLGLSPGSITTTAVAISALVMAEQHADNLDVADDLSATSRTYLCDLSETLCESLHWIAERQNTDGGWGDRWGEPSNVPTTLAVRGALQLTGTPMRYAEGLARVGKFITAAGGLEQLAAAWGAAGPRSAAICLHLALSDLIAWRRVPRLTLNRAILRPSSDCRVDEGCAALRIAEALACGEHRSTRNFIAAWQHDRLAEVAWNRLASLQQADGGFCGSVLDTSYVVMMLASLRRAHSPVVRRGVEFLLGRLNCDYSWCETLAGSVG